ESLSWIGSRIVIMDLMSQVQRTREDVQSYEGECPSVASAILANIEPVHDTHVHLVCQRRGIACYGIGPGPGPSHSRVGDQPAEVRNLRWLIGGARAKVMDEHAGRRVKDSPRERAGLGPAVCKCERRADPRNWDCPEAEPRAQRHPSSGCHRSD